MLRVDLYKVRCFMTAGLRNRDLPRSGLLCVFLVFCLYHPAISMTESNKGPTTIADDAVDHFDGGFCDNALSIKAFTSCRVASYGSNLCRNVLKVWNCKSTSVVHCQKLLCSAQIGLCKVSLSLMLLTSRCSQDCINYHWDIHTGKHTVGPNVFTCIQLGHRFSST